ncbi:MAG: type I methionyl aminopeptidase [Rhodothermales bacterium]|nr:type I methionyl aminopeptidase [Rhodothermales bacterium]
MVILKSDREIELLRECGDLVSRTLAEVAKAIQPGVSTLALDALAEEYIRSHGAAPAFKGYRVGNLVFPSTLCMSINDVVVHGIPGEHVLEEGDLVSVDCGVVLNGYFGDSAFTFGIGKISDEKTRLCQATYESLNLAIEQTILGNRIGDIGSVVQDRCTIDGFGVVRDLVGHGIGKKLHEAPQVPNYGERGVGKKLKRGIVLCIEPMVNQGSADVSTDDDGWTVRTADGTPSAHYEHMVAISSKGTEVLTTFAYIEELIETPYKQFEQVNHG